uniref:Uncharacterized protein n=1 Tax=Dunaliella tertiolecta TaxID=3047 RepID=A0A7S3R405_DUNTE
MDHKQETQPTAFEPPSSKCCYPKSWLLKMSLTHAMLLPGTKLKLCYSCKHGYTESAGRQVLRELLSTYNVADPGSDFYIPPEEKNEEGDTALMLACKAPEGSDEVVEMLLDAFPDQDLDVKDARGRAVWHLVPPSRSSVIVMLQRADERQRRLLGEEGWPNCG